jgi:hypothetical protein
MVSRKEYLRQKGPEAIEGPDLHPLTTSPKVSQPQQADIWTQSFITAAVLCRKVNRVGLPAIFWLASGNLDLEKVPIIPRASKRGSLCPKCANKMVHAEHVPHCWESGVLVYARRDSLCYQLPIQPMHTVLPDSISHVLSQLVLCDSAGRGHWATCAWFLWTPSTHFFPFLTLLGLLSLC